MTSGSGDPERPSWMLAKLKSTARIKELRGEDATTERVVHDQLAASGDPDGSVILWVYLLAAGCLGYESSPTSQGIEPWIWAFSAAGAAGAAALVLGFIGTFLSLLAFGFTAYSVGMYHDVGEVTPKVFLFGVAAFLTSVLALFVAGKRVGLVQAIQDKRGSAFRLPSRDTNAFRIGILVGLSLAISSFFIPGDIPLAVPAGGFFVGFLLGYTGTAAIQYRRAWAWFAFITLASVAFLPFVLIGLLWLQK